ncbi:MAG: sporulation initiation factor Spo0A C-terminal domain-containing protein [Clostridia bacterium]|nr:sporulation initiation factor Spo0A C-terminal domain-containing protein [Clostridia bacterium]
MGKSGFIAIIGVDENFIDEIMKMSGRADTVISDMEIGGYKSIIGQNRKITEVLNGIGMPPHLCGAKFLRAAVEVFSDGFKDNKRLYDVYKEVAEMCLTTPSKVERSIRNAIETAWNRNSYSRFNAVFGKNVFGRYDKPTNGEFIALLVDKVKYF